MDSDSDSDWHIQRRAELVSRQKKMGLVKGTPNRRQILRAAQRIGVNRALRSPLSMNEQQLFQATPLTLRASERQRQPAKQQQQTSCQPTMQQVLASQHLQGQLPQEVVLQQIKGYEQDRQVQRQMSKTMLQPLGSSLSSRQLEERLVDELVDTRQRTLHKMGTIEIAHGGSELAQNVQHSRYSKTKQIVSAANEREQNDKRDHITSSLAPSELFMELKDDQLQTWTSPRESSKKQAFSHSSFHERATPDWQEPATLVQKAVQDVNHDSLELQSFNGEESTEMETGHLKLDLQNITDQNVNMHNDMDSRLSIDGGENHNLVRFSVKLSGYRFSSKDWIDKGRKCSDPYLILKQEDRQVARTNVCCSTLDPNWKPLKNLVLRSDQPICLECWDMRDGGQDALIGKCEAMFEKLSKEKAQLAIMHMDGTRKVGIIRVDQVKRGNKIAYGSIVNMLQHEIFVSEGVDNVLGGLDHDSQDDTTVESSKQYFGRFKMFRVYDLDQPLAVSYRTVEGLGSAKPGVHYVPKTGIAYFESGSALAHFDIQILDDDRWEPIRDFVVQIQEVVEGRGTIGALYRTSCHIVDDDLYPAKVKRTEGFPVKPSEHILPSCIQSHLYLTADETRDTVLLRAFLSERWYSTWPSSFWAAFWSVYRAVYTVGMQIAVIIFIDHVWIDNEVAAAPGSGIREMSAGNFTLDEDAISNSAGMDHGSRLALAGVLASYVALGNWVYSCTDTWILANSKPGMTGKALRDWLVTQLMWADNGRLGMMRAADYLNAATSEVDEAAECYAQLFPVIERLARFFLNFVLVLVLLPVAAPLILVLVPVTILVQKRRSAVTRKLLHQRHEKERQYVSTLADIIENTHAFRGPPMSWIRTVFSDQTLQFAQAHFRVRNYALDTAGFVEIFAGFVLGLTFLAGTILVNRSVISKGICLGVINAFRSGSADILGIADTSIKIKICIEGLRTVSRIVRELCCPLQYSPSSLTHCLFGCKSMTIIGLNATGLVTEKQIQAYVAEQHTREHAKYERRDTADGSHSNSVSSPALPCNQMQKAWMFESSWDLLRNHAKEVAKAVQVADSLRDEGMRGLKWVNTVFLLGTPYKCSSRRALRGARRSHNRDPETTPMVRISAKFRLGGFMLLKGPTEEDSDILLRLVAGVDIIQKQESGSIYVPPFLKYAYVPESPVILEGSILKNLLLSVSSEDRESGAEPSADDAWEIAKRCGLKQEYLHAPETFNVGKGGRNIPITARQAICIARAILSDSCVIMIHKPTALLPDAHAKQIFTVLNDFCIYGGLHGLLNPGGLHRELLGTSPRDFLTGHAVRTVLFTRQHGVPMPPGVKKIVKFTTRWEEVHVRNSLHNYIGKKEWEGESKNTAVNILVRNNAIHGATVPTQQGVVRKRGQYNKAYKDRYFVCVSGCIFYYDSEHAYHKGVRANGSVELHGSTVLDKGFVEKIGFEWILHEAATDRQLCCASRSEHERNDWFAAIEVEGGNARDSNFSSSDSEELWGEGDSNPSSPVSTLSRSGAPDDQVQRSQKSVGHLKKRPIFHST